MSIMGHDEITNIIKNDDSDFIITPLLKENQIGTASIDLRLGTEFKVAVHSRNHLFGTIEEDLELFYQTTYRDFGEKIIIYPNQQVLADTFEYIRLPNNYSAFLITRSSLNRLGLAVSTYVQPGYAGTLTVSLENKSNTPLAIKSGMRFAQLVINKLDNPSKSYSDSETAKYVGDTSPVISGINDDEDLMFLSNIFNEQY